MGHSEKCNLFLEREREVKGISEWGVVCIIWRVLAYLPTVRVYEALHIHADCTGALVQDSKLGLVVEQSGHLKQ